MLVILPVMIILCFSFISSAIMHQAGAVVLRVDGTVRNLEIGMYGGYTSSPLYGSHTWQILSNMVNPGHNANETWVSVQDGEMTFFQALSATHKLCPNPAKPTTYSSTKIPNPSHLATEISLSTGATAGKTLQQSINDGDYCYTYVPPTYTYAWYTGSWGSYSPIDACNSQKTRPVACQRSANGVAESYVEDSYCTGAKPSSSSSCNHCRWVEGSYLAVWFTQNYCGETPISNPCDTATLNDADICKTDGGCFALWCAGTTQKCTNLPLANYCS